jgi:hypothetical protein
MPNLLNGRLDQMLPAHINGSNKCSCKMQLDVQSLISGLKERLNLLAKLPTFHSYARRRISDSVGQVRLKNSLSGYGSIIVVESTLFNYLYVPIRIECMQLKLSSKVIWS